MGGETRADRLMAELQTLGLSGSQQPVSEAAPEMSTRERVLRARAAAAQRRQQPQPQPVRHVRRIETEAVQAEPVHAAPEPETEFSMEDTLRYVLSYVRKLESDILVLSQRLELVETRRTAPGTYVQEAVHVQPEQTQNIPKALQGVSYVHGDDREPELRSAVAEELLRDGPKLSLGE